MLKSLKQRLLSRKKTSADTEIKVAKQNNLQQRFDSRMEVMTLAESGAHELARRTIAQAQMEKPKILVVGKEDTFTDAVLDYAVSLAERLGYDIMAMNVNTVMGHSGKFLSPFKKHLRDEFEKRADEAVEVLKQKASERGIQCEHIVKFGDLSKAMEELHHEKRLIEFVITEPEAHPEHPEAEVSIPVFSMLS